MHYLESTGTIFASVNDSTTSHALKEHSHMNEPRAFAIQQNIDHHFLELVSVGVSTPEPVMWRRISSALGPQAQFGWSWPIRNDNPPFLVPYCPQIIDEQTAELDDEELNDYLNVIKFIADGHIRMWLDKPDPVERQRAVENDLEARFPVSWEIWNRVRLRILDAHCS